MDSKLQAIVGVLLLTGTISANADTVRLAIPGENWSVTFKPASLTTSTDAQVSSSEFKYQGNAGRVNISLHIGAPKCPGGSTNQDLYACVGEKVMSRHGPWPLTAPPLNTPIGVQLKYLELIPSHKNMGKLVDENATQIFHAQLLFAHKGKWGDFHVSIVVRQSSDIQTAMELLNSFSIND